MIYGSGNLPLVDRVCRSHSLFKRSRPVTQPFFSRTAETAIATALGFAVLYTVGSIGPIALARWF